jgi:hypothetical protein
MTFTIKIAALEITLQIFRKNCCKLAANGSFGNKCEFWANGR